MPLPTIAAQGRQELAIDHLINAIADSPAWQAWTGAADATEARAFIHEYDTDGASSSGDDSDEATVARPHVVIGEESYSEESIAISDAHDFDEGGVVPFEFEADVPAAYKGDTATSKRYMRNQVGLVMQDVKNVAGTARYLNITRIEHRMVTMTADGERVNEGLYMQAECVVEYTG